jgi:hypothetical protein
MHHLKAQLLIECSGYMDPYSGSAQEDIRPRASSPHTAYASTYATTTEGSRAHSPKVEPHEQGSSSAHQYPYAARAPYEAATTAPSAYAYAQAHPAASTAYSYSSYATSVHFVA